MELKRCSFFFLAGGWPRWIKGMIVRYCSSVKPGSFVGSALDSQPKCREFESRLGPNVSVQVREIRVQTPTVGNPTPRAPTLNKYRFNVNCFEWGVKRNIPRPIRDMAASSLGQGRTYQTHWVHQVMIGSSFVSYSGISEGMQSRAMPECSNQEKESSHVDGHWNFDFQLNLQVVLKRSWKVRMM